MTSQTVPDVTAHPELIEPETPVVTRHCDQCGQTFVGTGYFCRPSCERAWSDEERRYEMYLDTRDDYLDDCEPPEPPEEDYFDD